MSSESKKIISLSKNLRRFFVFLFWYLVVALIVNTIMIPFVLYNKGYVSVGLNTYLFSAISGLVTIIVGAFLYKNLIYVLQNYQNGNYFSEVNNIYYKRIGLLVITTGVLSLIIGLKIFFQMPSPMTLEFAEPYLPIIKTIYGTMIFSGAYYTTLSFLIVYLFYLVMQEAIKINNENNHTV